MPMHDTAEDPVRSGREARRGTRARVTLAAAALFLVLGCGPPEDPILVAGRTLYEENCVECHGNKALGDGPMAASLPVQPASLMEHLAHHTVAELTRLITTGIPPAMPPAPVNEEEVRLIVDYLWTLVPEDQVEALREMQRQMEMMGMPGM